MDEIKLETTIQNFISIIPLFKKKLLHDNCKFNKGNLNHSHFQILAVLKKEGKLPISEVGKKLVISTPNMTKLLTKLIEEDMVGKYKVITLCGSTRFKEQFMEAQKRLTLEGNIVISVGLFGHSGDNEVWTEGTKTMLDDMHKRKIDMADEIFVINVGGYIGESTKSEIAFAKSFNKEIIYYTDLIG